MSPGGQWQAAVCWRTVQRAVGAQGLSDRQGFTHFSRMQAESYRRNNTIN